MEEMQQQSVEMEAWIRDEVYDVWGEKTEKIIKACQYHMSDAVSTEFTLHQRFQCYGCKQRQLMVDFFAWLNEEGYCYVIEDFEIKEFMSHVVRWAQGWAKEEMLNPCTDGMPSSQVH